jgi:hypothetical protein
MNYIQAASALWATEKEKAVLEARIKDLQDALLGEGGMQAVKKYREEPMRSPILHPLTAVTDLLKEHYNASWGRSLPDGLCTHDITYATGLSEDEVRTAIEEIEYRGTHKLHPDFGLLA